MFLHQPSGIGRDTHRVSQPVVRRAAARRGQQTQVGKVLLAVGNGCCLVAIRVGQHRELPLCRLGQTRVDMLRGKEPQKLAKHRTRGQDRAASFQRPWQHALDDDRLTVTQWNVEGLQPALQGFHVHQMLLASCCPLALATFLVRFLANFSRRFFFQLGVSRCQTILHAGEHEGRWHNERLDLDPAAFPVQQGHATVDARVNADDVAHGKTSTCQELTGQNLGHVVQLDEVRRSFSRIGTIASHLPERGGQ